MSDIKERYDELLQEYFILRDTMVELSIAPFESHVWFKERAKDVLKEIGYYEQ